MAAKDLKIENKLSSPRTSKRLRRSLSPNNVVIDGQIIDRNPSKSFVLPRNDSFTIKSAFLDNILEESDPTLQSQLSQENNSQPLEDAVKLADKNVQRFIYEMTNESTAQKYLKDIKLGCTKSQQEPLGLTDFLSNIDDASKNKIVGTLVNVYKKEILSSASSNAEKEGLINQVHDESKDKERQEFGDGYNIKQIKKKPFLKISDISVGNKNIKSNTMIDFGNTFKRDDLQSNSTLKNVDNVNKSSLNLDTELVVNYHTLKKTKNFKPDDSVDSIDFRPLSLPPIKHFDLKNPFRIEIFDKKDAIKKKEDKGFSSNIEICPSKEEAIARILGKKPRENISKPKVVLRKNKHSVISDTPTQNLQSIDQYYEDIKKSIADPQFIDMKTFKSEGIQADYGVIKRHRNYHKHKLLYFVKPYKYHTENAWESKSDIVMECPFGCHLKFKKSKSDTDVTSITLNPKKSLSDTDLKCKINHKENYNSDGNKPKKRGILTKKESKEKSMSVITVNKKPSTQLLHAYDVRRKNHLISFLEDDLKRGDSEFHISQVLFKSSTKNIDKDVSSLIIPALDDKDVDNFNANYLLHAINIQKKSEIMPSSNYASEYVDYTISNPSVTEEDYEIWLKKQNWAKYSNMINDIKAVEHVDSDFETKLKQQPKQTCGDYGYFLDRGDQAKPPSTPEQTSSFVADLCELFLYEHVVISRTINFCYSFNANRTKVLGTIDRIVQVMVFASFFFIWHYLGKYVFSESKYKGSTVLWK